MILLFELIIICHVWVIGITIVTQPGMLLESVREWGNKIHDRGEKWIEPVFLCHWCAPSLHSIFAYGFAFAIGVINEFEWKLIWMYPLVAMGASLLNGIVWGAHKLIEAKTKYYINAEKLKYFDIADRKAKHKRGQ